MSRPPRETELTIALGGDAMLAGEVGTVLRARPKTALVGGDVREVLADADLFVLNLECCISDRGKPWPDPKKPFFFRAPPAAAEALASLGVDCVTLANNHAMDYGEEALLDTFVHLGSAGIRWVGAGAEVTAARAPVILEAQGVRLAVIGAGTFPPEYGATAERPGIAYVALRRLETDWLLDAITGADADARLLTIHWGPNYTLAPVPYVRIAAATVAPLATVVAGHSAHAFHGASRNVAYDLGGFVDDYSPTAARDAISQVAAMTRGPGARPRLRFLARYLSFRARMLRHARLFRHELGLLCLARLRRAADAVTGEALRLNRLEFFPLRIDYRHTRLAAGKDLAWARRRFTQACADLGTAVDQEGERFVVRPDA